MLTAQSAALRPLADDADVGLPPRPRPGGRHVRPKVRRPARRRHPRRHRRTPERGRAGPRARPRAARQEPRATCEGRAAADFARALRAARRGGAAFLRDDWRRGAAVDSVRRAPTLRRRRRDAALFRGPLLARRHRRARRGRAPGRDARPLRAGAVLPDPLRRALPRPRGLRQLLGPRARVHFRGHFHHRLCLLGPLEPALRLWHWGRRRARRRRGLHQRPLRGARPKGALP
mmetsp:Transcript_7812/g.25482  ORF Transcript_7812/g.25482 Transcript_7812/m.25482 type:complete len:232 (-) Transcript_7812:154-849(-)